MSHDLKTPVGNAMMYTELMADDIKHLADDHPELEDRLNPLIQYCRNIHLSSSKLVNAIQSWGYAFQLEDGIFEAREGDVDLKSLLENVIASNHIFISGKELQVDLQYQSSHAACRLDSEIMTLIFDNLLMLFINMARRGDVIRITATDEEGLMIRFFAPNAAFKENLTEMFRGGLSIADHEVPDQGILKPGGYGLLFASLALEFMNARFGVDENGAEPEQAGGEKAQSGPETPPRSFWICLPLS